MAEIKIRVKLNIEGLHRWKDCDIEEVMYLKHLHRHLFYIRIEKQVSHNDRDIEIIKFKKSIIDYLNLKWYDDKYKCLMFDNMSCENIAENLYNKFLASSVEVLEDNENGAIITKEIIC